METPPSRNITIHFGKTPEGTPPKNESVTVNPDGTVTVITVATNPGVIRLAPPPLTPDEVHDVIGFLKLFQEAFAQTTPKDVVAGSTMTEEMGQRMLDGASRRILELQIRLSTFAPDSYPTPERLAAWREEFCRRELNRPVLPNP